MKIRILAMIVSLVLVVSMHPASVMAHTGLQSSIPAEGEVVNEQFKEIIMEFNTEVEALSNFKLKDESGNEVAIENMVVNNKTMSGIVKGIIENGEYAVEWKIVGRDGHPIEGKINFVVKSDTGGTGGVTTEEAEQTPSPEEIQSSNEPVVEPTTEVSDEKPLNGDEKNSGKSSNSAIGIWVVVGITAIALISIVVSRRKKK